MTCYKSFLVYETTCENMFFLCEKKKHIAWHCWIFVSMIHSTTANCDVLPMEKPGAAAHSAKHAITRGWLVGSLRRPSLVAHFFFVVEIDVDIF